MKKWIKFSHLLTVRAKGGNPPHNIFYHFNKLSNNIRVLYSMTHTSKKYERTQLGNQLASSSEVVAAKVSLFLRRFLWCLVIQASEVSLSNGQVEKSRAVLQLPYLHARSPVKTRSVDLQRNMFDQHQCNVHIIYWEIVLSSLWYHHLTHKRVRWQGKDLDIWLIWSLAFLILQLKRTH